MKIKFTVDRIENDQAVLKTVDNQTIVWPIDKLPTNVAEGMVLNFTLASDDNKEQDEKALAKDILNEILDTNA